MNEQELLAKVARDLGIAPAHPDVDQMDAAVAQTVSVARALAKRGAVHVSLADDSEVPAGVVNWLNMFSDRMSYDGRVCDRNHVQRGTPTTLFASKPNVRYCYGCTDRRARKIAMDAQCALGQFAMDCDFCGEPRDVHGLRVVVIPVVSVLVRAFGCARCMAGAGVPA